MACAAKAAILPITWSSGNPTTHELPQHLVKVREGNDETVHYFHDRGRAGASSATNNPDLDLGLSGEQEGDTAMIERKRRTARRAALGTRSSTRAKPSTTCWSKLAKKGFSVEHYSAQDKPLFELIEGEGEKQQVKPLFSIPEILTGIKEVGTARAADQALQRSG